MLCNNTVLSTEKLQLAALTRVYVYIWADITESPSTISAQCWTFCGDATDDVTAAARAAVVCGDKSGRDR